MTAATAMMMTVTLSMACAMVPRTFWASLRSDDLFEEGEPWRLRLLQAEQNAWVRRHLGYGVTVLVLACLALGWGMQEVAAVLALYGALSFVFAAGDSLLAQRIERLVEAIPEMNDWEQY